MRAYRDLTLQLQPRITEVTMLKHHNDVPNARHSSRFGTRQMAAVSLIMAGLSCFAFVALYRAPLPAEAFTALAVQLADKADMARAA
jgi:hypothetical protein